MYIHIYMYINVHSTHIYYVNKLILDAINYKHYKNVLLY